jgi:uncharacterized protein
MNTDKNTILDSLKSTLKELYKDRLAKIILYGSYARGEAHGESDMDFLVVLNDEQISVGEEIRYISPQAYLLTLDFNIVISYMPTTLRKLQFSNNLFYRTIRKEGIEI